MQKITIIILTILFASCGALKKIDKQKTDSSVKTESDSSAVVTAKVDTKITETIDTIITRPASTIEGRIHFVDNKPFVLEDDDQKITVTKDGKLTGQVKPKVIPIKAAKVTEIKLDTKSTVKESEKKNEEKKTVSVDKDIKRSGQIWLWLFIILIGLGCLLYRNRKILFGLFGF